jgi:hypothetical protein
MPMDKSRYPVNWNEIATAIKEAAGWKCEECGAKHGDYIVRSDIDGAYFIILDMETMWFKYPDGTPVFEYPEEYAANPTVRVKLTVHHIGVDKPDGTPGSPEDKMDCRTENLIALCPRCHLIADMPGNIPKRKFTRLEHKRQAQVEAGQGELF